MVKKRKMRNKRNQSKNNLGTKLAVISAIVILTALVAAGAFLALNTEKSVLLDQANLCPGIGSRGTVAILLDTTDGFSQITKEEVRQNILEVQRTLPRYYRVSVFTLDEDGLEHEPVASVCNPGRLDQMDNLAQQGLTANPALISKKYSEFEVTISEALETIFEEKFEAKRSPILSSLQELSVIIPEPVNVDVDSYQAGRNKIVLVTDLLEHTDIFSVYQSGLDFDAFRASRATEKFGKSYSALDVEMLVVRRGQVNYSTMDVVRFWAKIFREEFSSEIKSIKILSGEI